MEQDKPPTEIFNRIFELLTESFGYLDPHSQSDIASKLEALFYAKSRIEINIANSENLNKMFNVPDERGDDILFEIRKLIHFWNEPKRNPDEMMIEGGRVFKDFLAIGCNLQEYGLLLVYATRVLQNNRNSGMLRH